MDYQVGQDSSNGQGTQAVQTADPNSQGGILASIFGGANQAGFLGGGHNVANAQNFDLPGFMQAINNYSGLTNAALQGGQSQFAGGQQQLANNLFGTLSGHGPSVAQQQLAQTTNQNVANAYAMAAANPSNPGAARNAANNASSVNQQAAGQGSLLRAQEIQNAQGMLGNVLSSGRGQDINQFQAQNQAAQGWMGQQLQAQMAQQQGQENYESNKLASLSGAQSAAIGGKVISAAGGAAGAMGMAGGGFVPGYATGGDSAANDTVQAMLSPGEIVVPRSIVQSKDAAKKAAAFVEAVKAKHRRKAA